jgi:hypothetical protein
MHPREYLLRCSPRSSSTGVDGAGGQKEGSNPRLRRHRRNLLIGAVAVAVVVAATAAWATGQSPDSARVGLPVTKHHLPVPLPGTLRPDPVTGSLVLPLTGEVSADGLGDQGSASAGGTNSMASGRVPGSSAKVSSPDTGDTYGGASADQSVDVPPGSSQTMHRLSTHASSDGVIVSTFYAADAPAPEPPSTISPPVAPVAVNPSTEVDDNLSDTSSSPGVSPPSPPARIEPTASSCSPSGELTLEISDTQAVATFTEPFYGGFTTPLVDLEIGEMGVTEGKPATWVEAQVGPQARLVEVRFADGATDSVSPAGGAAVLTSLGDASWTLGDGTHAFLEVRGEGGTVLAKYAIGVGTPRSSGPVPATLPGSGTTLASPPPSAVEGVTSALTTALSCGEPPVIEAQAVSGGGPFEELGGAGSAGLSPGDRIAVEKAVFTSSTSAVVKYRVDIPGGSDPQSLYADATLVRGSWLVSLGSVAPGLQIAPPNQDGDVAVAPGGPLFVHTGTGGVAIAVYRAAQSNPPDHNFSGSGCGLRTCTAKPSTVCAPTGGIVEEITTPGAVAIESAPLFGNYSDPIIGLGLSIVGEAEGAPATVLGVEVGPDTSSVTVDASSGRQTIVPVDGEVDTVLNGAPSSAIGPKGGSVSALGASGNTIASVPLLVDSTEPATASSLPRTLPEEPGTGPSDPAAARGEIDQAFSTVFDCDNSPLLRSGEIQDDGMFANPLEQLYLGPYTSLVESVYATVGQVVFVNPDLADVNYTIRFHGSSMTFDMIGTAVVVDGSWRVSYATLCAAVALGGVSCSS